MRYILLLIFISCNANRQQSEPDSATIPEELDSLIVISDSLNQKIVSVDSLVTASALMLQDKVAYLNRQKQLLQTQLNNELNNASPNEPRKLREPSKSDRDDISRKIRDYENQIADLKRRLYLDSLLHARQTGKPIKKAVDEKPGLNSLMIEFESGKLPTENITVYLIPYSRKNRKHLQYEIHCGSDIDQLGKRAGYYDGIYFFNDVEPGKYIVKVCTYYGNYKVIKRQKGEQLVKMELAPPVQ